MNLWLWAMLLCVIAVLAVVEFALLAHRPRPAGVKPGEAMAGTGLWLVAVVLFARVIFVVYKNNWLGIQTVLSRPLDNVAIDGETALAQFVTVFLVETALSLDNIAILSLLLAYYRVPSALAARVLYWAVTLALVLRLLLIFAVGPLSVSYDWFHYVFASLLLIAAVRTLLIPDSSTDVARGWIPRMIAKLVPVSRGPNPRDNARLTTVIRDPATGRVRVAITSLTAVVLVVAIADITYAADFLPAAYSVTRDPFIAAAGNAFSLLMLRSLYFTIAPFMGRFRYLKLSLVFILLYIAVNTVFYHDKPLAAEVTLCVAAGILLIGVLASVLVNKRKGLPTLPIGALLDPVKLGELAQTHGADEASTQARTWSLESRHEPRPAPIDDLVEAAAATRRNFRKVCILIAGTVVILFGIVIAPLPGPGPTILVPIGIAILATEFIWAKRLLDNLKAHGDRLAKKSDSLTRRIPKWAGWVAIPVWCGVWFGLWWLVRHYDLWKTLVMMTAFGTSFPFAVWAWRLIRRKPG